MLRVSNFAVAVMRMLSAMFFISSRRRHTRYIGDWSSDVCSSDLLGVKLPHLAAWSVARRTAADFYREEFSRQELAKHIVVPTEPYRDGTVEHHIYHQFVIRAERRDELKEHLRTNGIGTEIYYPIPLHLQECFSYLDYNPGDLPEAEHAARETLALPMYPELSREAQRF